MINKIVPITLLIGFIFVTFPGTVLGKSACHKCMQDCEKVMSKKACKRGMCGPVCGW